MRANFKQHKADTILLAKKKKHFKKCSQTKIKKTLDENMELHKRRIIKS